MKKLHPEYKDEKNKKRGRLGDAKDPRAKKDDSLLSRITGTNSSLSQPVLAGPAPAPPASAPAPVSVARDQAMQHNEQPQYEPEPQLQNNAQPMHALLANMMRNMAQQQEAFLQMVQTMGPAQQLVARAPPAVPLPRNVVYTAAEAYQRPAVTNEAEARARSRQLQQVMMDRGKFTANQAPDHLRHIPAVEEAEQRYVPSVRQASAAAQAPVQVKRERSPSVKQDASPVKRERTVLDLTKDDDL